MARTRGRERQADRRACKPKRTEITFRGYSEDGDVYNVLIYPDWKLAMVRSKTYGERTLETPR